jgi:hypothetical protein
MPDLRRERLLCSGPGGRRSARCTVSSPGALHCTALHCTALHCTALHCTALHCTALNIYSPRYTRKKPAHMTWGGIQLCCNALHTMHCTVHSAHCTVHSAHCTLHTAHCTLHTAHCTLHTAHCTVHTAHCTLHTAQCTLHSADCTLHTAHCTLHTAHCSALQRTAAHQLSEPLQAQPLLCPRQAGPHLGHCTALHCTALHCTALHCTALHCTALPARPARTWGCWRNIAHCSVYEAWCS